MALHARVPPERAPSTTCAACYAVDPPCAALTHVLLFVVLCWIRAMQSDIFFVGLLPPIILGGTLSLDTRFLVHNFGAVSLLAFVGTVIACFVIGLIQ